MNTHSHTSQRGAVSIFIVIFTALLVTIVTASFVQVMLRNQQQATNNDLSQSAYDSALAGVEDAKRALVALKTCELNPNQDAACTNLRSTLANSGKKCNVLGDPNVAVAKFTDGEVQVGDVSKNQAYNCVTIRVNTESYVGKLDKDQAVVIPLKSVGDPNNIKKIRISWFQQKDVPGAADGAAVMPQYTPGISLPAATSWPKNQPPIMRSQFVQFVSGKLSLSSFDTPGTNNARTLFLYPSLAGAANLDYAVDARRNGASLNTPAASECKTEYTLNGSFACSVEIAVPDIAGPGETRQAYLQLASLYNGASYKVQLLGASDSGQVIEFSNVQPVVDSTGRASDLFRRVRANVSITESGLPETYPEGEISLGKSLCKDFFVTDKSTDYLPSSGGPTCDPSN